MGRGLWSKRINEIDQAILKIGQVSGGNGKSVDACNGGDLTVEIAQGSADVPAVGLDFAKNPRSRLIEVQQPRRKRRRDKSFESIFKQAAAPALWHGV